MKQQRHDAKIQPVTVSGSVAHGMMPAFQPGNNGFSDVIGALDSSGQKINEILAREYRRRRESEVRALGLAATAEFETWRAEYEQTRLGSDGLNAAEDYAAKWAEISRETAGKLNVGSDEIFRGQLDRELAERGLFAVRDGIRHAGGQRQVWQQSVLSSQMAELQDYAARNPDDADGIAFKRQKILQSMAQVKPGQDLRGMILELDGKTFAARMDSHEAAGDYASMERMLQGRDFLLEHGITADSPLGSWAAAYNNPGCVTTDEKHMAMFESMPHGVAAIMDRAQAYARDRGAKSIADIMNIYAPPTENNTAAYIAYVSKATGKKATDRIDVNDPVFLKAFARAIIRYENSMEVSDADLESGLQYLREKGKPPAVGKIPVNRAARLSFLAPGVDPARVRRWRQAMENGIKAQKSRDLENATLQIASALYDLPAARQMEYLNSATENMPPEDREKAREALFATVMRQHQRENFSRDLAEERERAEAEERLESGLAEMRKLPPEERTAYVNAVKAPTDSQTEALQRSLFAWQKEREQQEAAAWKETWQGQLEKSLAEVANTSPAMQQGRLASWVQACAKSSSDADEMLAWGKSWLERQNQYRESSDNVIIEQLAAETQKRPAAYIRDQINAMAASGQLSAEGRRRASEQLLGPASKESLENTTALSDAKFIISQGGLASENDRREYARVNNMTLAQTKELLAFQGHDANGIYNRILTARKRYGFADTSPREMDLLLSFLPRDREATDRDIDNIIRASSAKESALFFPNTLLDQLAENHSLPDDWLPEIENYEIPRLKAQLKAMALPPSQQNMQILKKQILAHSLGLGVANDFMK